MGERTDKVQEGYFMEPRKQEPGKWRFTLAVIKIQRDEEGESSGIGNEQMGLRE